MDSSQKLKGLIIGSTGAIGRELVRELLVSKNWSEVHVIVRKEVDLWNNLNEEEKNKLRIVKVDDFETLQDTSKFNNFQGLNSVFCCLGAVQKNGKENFIKVDQHYPLYTADIALKNNIPQYHIVTSQKSDKNSMFFYFRIKGEVEHLLSLKKLNFLGIYRPGLLLNRSEPRFVEKICQYIPFIRKADVKDIAKSMRIQSEKNATLLHSQPTTQIYENEEILKIATSKL